MLLAAVQAESLRRAAWAADPQYVTVETSDGKVRGVITGGVNCFKGIPYGASTAGKNRFMPPVKPAKWTGVRDALAYGPTAPQNSYDQALRRHVFAPKLNFDAPPMGEDCLVLNVFTPAMTGKRPVMVYLHGGGYSGGSGSLVAYDGVNLAHNHDVVLVTINHRLNALGQTYLGDALGPDFEASSSVGFVDIVAALQWVHENIERFGGDPGMVTIFGQSGGGMKVAILMAMPSAKGLFQRAIIESGPVLRLIGHEDATARTNMMLKELGLDRSRARDLWNVPLDKFMIAESQMEQKLQLEEALLSDDANVPLMDGKVIAQQPWDPSSTALSNHIPFMIGWTMTEATNSEKPTPENMAMDEAGLRQHALKRMKVDPEPVIAAFRETFPNSTPWDLWVYIRSNHAFGTWTQEMAKRRARVAGAAPAWVYRFDW
jgi:para-nitrobenzyl esterase